MDSTFAQGWICSVIVWAGNAATGGGAGGLFIPLVTLGWLLGRVVEGIVGTGTSLFAVVGAAAFLGAGYRTPIAAVVFVAEASRGPGFIVPALIATAVSQLLMGAQSVSSAQLARRADPSNVGPPQGS